MPEHDQVLFYVYGALLGVVGGQKACHGATKAVDCLLLFSQSCILYMILNEMHISISFCKTTPKT